MGRGTILLFGVVSAMAGVPALANPLGPSVVNGQANFATTGNTLTVTNTPGTIINWQAFSIGANEVTRFAQQSAASTVLNRVTGGVSSSILGTLQSNGRVFLVNPSGIVFGAGATVDVAGLVATTLNLSNADFLSGRYHFTQMPGAQNISNAGNITAQQGGQIYLIAPNVENTGIITAPNGEILLAAGHQVELVNSLDPNLRVNITAPAGDATNVGKLVAEAGSLGLFGTVVRNSGTVSADSAVMQGGKIVFKASQRAEVGGQVNAIGTTGGLIQALGNEVRVTSGAHIDASGQLGGGTILIGGDAHGANPSVQNAQNTFISDATVIKADAMRKGNGGKVVVWADSATRFNGNISTQGGSISGNGGWVEVSGKQWLSYSGLVNTLAPQGMTGALLLDPTDITISAALDTATMTNAAGIFSDVTTTPSNLNVATLQNQLGLSSVTVDTTSGLAGIGNISVQAPIAWNSANSLTFNATGAGAINVNATIGNAGTGGVTMQTAGGGINLNAAVTLGGGAFTANAGTGTIAIVGAGGSTIISTGSGAINLTGGWIREVGGVISTTGTLTTNSTSNNPTASGTSLNGGTNMVGSFNATAAGGTVYLVNGTALNLTGITAPDILVNNTGALSISGAATAANSVSLTGVGITNNSTVTGPLGVALNAGTGTLFNAMAISSITNGGGAATGPINLVADTMSLAGGTITGGAGTVALSTSTPTRSIDVGTAIGTSLSLLGADLQTISTTNGLVIGATATGTTGITYTSTGGLSVSGPLTVADLAGIGGGSWGFRLGSLGGAMMVNAPISKGSGFLTLENSGGAISVGGNLSVTSGSINLFGIGVSNNATIAAPGGISINANAGVLSNAAGVISNGGGANTGAISLIADTMSLAGGTITGGAGIVSLNTSTLSRNINLGTAVGTSLSLLGTDLQTISTSNGLVIGGNGFSNNTYNTSSSGGVTVSSAITAANLAGIGCGGYCLSLVNFTGNIAVNAALNSPVGVKLNTTGAVTETGGLINTSGLLAITSGTGATLNGANTVGSFSATNTTSGAISFTNTAPTLVVAGVTQNGIGGVTINNTGNIDTSTGAMTVNATAANTMSLIASGSITIGSGVTATGAGSVTNLVLDHGTMGTASLASALSLNGGNLDVQSAGVIGAGTLRVTAGTTTLTGALTASAINLSAGTLNLNGAATTLTSLSMSGGTLSNAAALNIGTFTGPTGGNAVATLTGAGAVNLTGSSTITAMDGLGWPATLVVDGLGKVLTNTGTFTMSSSTAWAALQPINGASLVNGSAGTWNMTSAIIGSGAPYAANASAGANSFTNLGTIVIGGTTKIGEPFTNNGIVNVNAGTFQLNNAGTVTHTGIFNTAAPGSINFAGGAHTLNNATAITGLGNVTFSGASSNSITGSVVSGSISNNGTAVTTITGATTVNSANVAGGTLSLNNAGTTGLTSIITSGGVLNLNGAATTLTSLTMSGGTLSNAAALNVGTFTGPTGGNAVATLTGAGAVNLTGSSTITAMDGLGWPATLVVDGAGKVLTNTGTFTMTSSTAWAALQPINGASLVNGSAGTWNMTSAIIGSGAPYAANASAGANSFTNLGNVVIGGTTKIGEPFTNNGIVNVNAGTFQLNNAGTVTHTGTFNTATGAVINFAAGTHSLTNATAAITGAGNVTFSGASVNSISGIVNSTGSISNSGTAVTTITGAITVASANVSGGTLNLNGAAATTLTNLTISGGTLSNAATLNIGSLTGPTGGNAVATLTGAGAVNLTGSSTITAMDGLGWPATLVVDGAGKVLTNTGTFTMTSSTAWAALQPINGASLVNGSAGTWNMTSAIIGAGAPYAANASAGANSFTNLGTVVIGGTTKIGEPFTNNGIVNVNAGTFQLNNTVTQSGTINIATPATLSKSTGFTNTGTLSGSGTIVVGTGAAGLINQGNINPGGTGAAGTLSITGDLQLSTGSILNMELGGTGAGQSDKLAVTGSITTAGTLNASLLAGYAPVNADAIPFMTMGGTATGTFASSSLPAYFSAGYNLAAGEAARLIYSGGSTITFTNAGGGLDWATPGNWSSGVLPGALDTVLISTGLAVGHATGAHTIAALTINSANSLNVSGGSLTVSGITTLDGGLTVSGTGSATLNGALNGTTSGQLSILGGSLNLGAAASVNALSMSGGTLGGSGAVTASTMNWTGGTATGAGVLTVTTALNMPAGVGANAWNYTFLDGKTLNNNGVATFGSNQNAGGNGADLRLLNGAIINNNGTWNINYANINSTGVNTFNNVGVLNFGSLGWGGTVNAAVNNTGTVNVVQDGAIFGSDVTGNGILNSLAGTTVINGPTFTAGTLNLIGGTLSGTSSLMVTNSFSQSQGTLGNAFSSINITQATGNLAVGSMGATGAVGLTATSGSITINNAIAAASINGQATGITLGAGGTLSASGAGNAIVLNAGTGNFINNAGAAALTNSGGGRWLVYSSGPALDTFGGLVSGNLALWGKTYASYAPASVAETGNRYLFGLAPTLTVSVGALTKTYGAVLAAPAATVTGLVDAAVYGNVFMQDVMTGAASITSTGFAANAGVLASPYVVTVAAGTLAAPAGYATAYTNGTLTVNPAPLTVTANAQNKVYGSADPALTYVATGLIGTDTLTGTQTRVAGENVGTYAISQGTLANANYTITYSGNSLGITPATLTVSANASGKLQGGVDPQLTYIVTGLQFTDTAATTLSGALSRVAGETAGTYPIGQGTLALLSANYSMSYVPANFTINTPTPVPAPVPAPVPVSVPAPVPAPMPAPLTASIIVTTLANTVSAIPVQSQIDMPPATQVVTAEQKQDAQQIAAVADGATQTAEPQTSHPLPVCQ